MNIEALVHDIIDPLVENRDAIMIREMPSTNDDEIVILVVGESSDVARLIGRGGSVADSIRKVVSVLGKLNNKKIRIKFESYDDKQD